MAGRQSALQRLGKNSISAKDIANQAWCEKQMELYIKNPFPTQAMEKGSAFHETKKVEVFVPLSVEPRTWADRIYKNAYENYTSLGSLRAKGFCRELRVYGSLNGFKLAGQLDELRMLDGKVMVVEDKTISGNGGSTSLRSRPDTIQVSLYKKLLDDIAARRYTFDNFANAYELERMALSPEFIKGLEGIGVRRELIGIREMCRAMFDGFMGLPQIGDVLEIRYFERGTGKKISEMQVNYNAGDLEAWIQNAMIYWRGEREAQPVPESEKWKCKMCKFFGKECTVWWGR